MQLPLSDGRAVRMIQALLAAADPLDRVAHGAPPSTYDALAVAVLAELRQGADGRRIVLLLSEYACCDPQHHHIHLEPVVAFAQATMDWWANAETRWLQPLAS
ncbi:MAG TPA: hypothetical protein VM307_03235 [Egibacteraceae bacterium]|nr:hypothetical protein [Egibacteraceae bacterium]